jgi:hypothetical protein
MIGCLAGRLAAFPAEACREDDPDRVDQRRGDDLDEPRERRAGRRVDPADGEHDAGQREPERSPRPGSGEPLAHEQREDGHDRRVDVDDQGSERRRDRLDAGVVRRRVADVEHAERDGGRDLATGESAQCRAAGGRREEPCPRKGGADEEPPGEERQPGDACRIDRFGEQRARAERTGGHAHERDPQRTAVHRRRLAAVTW